MLKQINFEEKKLKRTANWKIKLFENLDLLWNLEKLMENSKNILKLKK